MLAPRSPGGGDRGAADASTAGARRIRRRRPTTAASRRRHQTRSARDERAGAAGRPTRRRRRSARTRRGSARRSSAAELAAQLTRSRDWRPPRRWRRRTAPAAALSLPVGPSRARRRRARRASTAQVRPYVERIIRARQFGQARQAANPNPTPPATRCRRGRSSSRCLSTSCIADYRAAEAATGIDWYWLAAIHLQETRMGRIIGTSSAGAVGPMQFLPTTWARCCTGDPTVTRDAIIGAAHVSRPERRTDRHAGRASRVQPERHVRRHGHGVRREHARQPEAVRRVPRVAGVLQHVGRHGSPSDRLLAGSAHRRCRATSPAIPKTPAEYGGRMADLLEISSRIIDSGVVDQPINRVTNELSELGDDLAIVESFSHCVAFDSGDGWCASTRRACTPARRCAPRCAAGDRPGRATSSTRTVTPITSAAARSSPPTHRSSSVTTNVATRLDRYDYTNNWNLIINARQFGGIPGELNLSIGEAQGGADGRHRRRPTLPAVDHAAALGDVR